MSRLTLYIVLLWTAIILYAASVALRLGLFTIIARAASGGGL